MIQSSSCPQWQLDRPGPAGDHDGLAVVTPLTGTRSISGELANCCEIGGKPNSVLGGLHCDSWSKPDWYDHRQAKYNISLQRPQKPLCVPCEGFDLRAGGSV